MPASELGLRTIHAPANAGRKFGGAHRWATRTCAPSGIPETTTGGCGGFWHWRAAFPPVHTLGGDFKVHTQQYLHPGYHLPTESTGQYFIFLFKRLKCIEGTVFIFLQLSPVHSQCIWRSKGFNCNIGLHGKRQLKLWFKRVGGCKSEAGGCHKPYTSI